MIKPRSRGDSLRVIEDITEASLDPEADPIGEEPLGIALPLWDRD